MTINDILEKYPKLPHKFKVRFALFCANDVKHLIKDPRSLEALEFVELWLEDRASEEDMMYAPLHVNNNTFADSCVRATMYSVINYSNTEDVYEAVSYAAYALSISEMKYRNKLLEMITELTDMEKLLYLK